MKTKLSIPDNVVENAAYIYRKIASAKLTRGRTMTSLISASLYAACRENNIPRTLDDIDAGNVERKIISRDLRTIIKKLGLNLNQYDTASFISKLSNNLNLREKTKREAFEILRKCENEEITAGKTSCSTSSSLLVHFMCTKWRKIKSEKFAVESGVSDVTIRNRVVLIKKTLELVEFQNQITFGERSLSKIMSFSLFVKSKIMRICSIRTAFNPSIVSFSSVISDWSLDLSFFRVEISPFRFVFFVLVSHFP